MTEPTLTIVNSYALTSSAKAFVAAISALAARVKTEGHPGVLSYRFFVNVDQATARAVIDYAGPSAWIGHHDIAMAWPEMKALHHAATLAEVTFLGPMTDDIRRWLEGSGLKSVAVHSGFDFAAGFRRDQSPSLPPHLAKRFLEP